ncbi:MAG: DUF5020 family protein [Bacteroidales bacterium]|nr:DUF5020 family protein [Bacteroidales bacterium]
MKKGLRILIIATLALLPSALRAQTNVQVLYEFAGDRQYVTTTFSMFKPDRWGDTFFFIDHYFANSTDRNYGLASAINGSYFEIERGLNFWQDTPMKDFSLHVEYDGATWGAGIWCFGGKYSFHNADFSNTASIALMYDLHCGLGSSEYPFKLTGVWTLNDLFGLKGLQFSGFADFWGNDQNILYEATDLRAGGGKRYDMRFSILSEPQLWYRIGSLFGCDNLNIGGEVELTYNFANTPGFFCRPCAGIKWDF